MTRSFEETSGARETNIDDSLPSSYVLRHGKVFVWHALSAGLAWAVLAPFAAATARFSRAVDVIGRDVMFRWHRFAMICTVILTAQTWIIGVAFAKNPPPVHSALGSVVLFAALTQTVVGLFRPPVVAQLAGLDIKEFERPRKQHPPGQPADSGDEEQAILKVPADGSSAASGNRTNARLACTTWIRSVWARFHISFGFIVMIFTQWVLWHSLQVFELGKRWQAVLAVLIALSYGVILLAELVKLISYIFASNQNFSR